MPILARLRLVLQRTDKATDVASRILHFDEHRDFRLLAVIGDDRIWLFLQSQCNRRRHHIEKKVFRSIELALQRSFCVLDHADHKIHRDENKRGRFVRNNALCGVRIDCVAMTTFPFP